MSVRGSLNADQLILSSVAVDWMKAQGVQVKVLAALVDTSSGKSRAWVDGTGIVWSSKTGRALEALRQAMEEDLAAEHLRGAQPATEEQRGLDLSGPSGLGENLGTVEEPPSV